MQLTRCLNWSFNCCTLKQQGFSGACKLRWLKRTVTDATLLHLQKAASATIGFVTLQITDGNELHGPIHLCTLPQRSPCISACNKNGAIIWNDCFQYSCFSETQHRAQQFVYEALDNRTALRKHSSKNLTIKKKCLSHCSYNVVHQKTQ